MSAVGGPVIRRIIEVAKTDEPADTLLASVGLDPDVEALAWMQEAVAEDAYYDLLERVTPADDRTLPMRYAAALRIDDFGALGLAMKTASTLRDTLLRLSRYILVLSDTLEYELTKVVGGGDFTMSRPSHRRGAHLANECAISAVFAMLNQVSSRRVAPVAVSFRHDSPPSAGDHEAFFGCPVRFGAGLNALHLSDESLGTKTRLGDEGLSAFVLSTLDELKVERRDRSIEDRVYATVMDSLPDGRPRKAQVARRLGMSERTLHRRLSEIDETFQSIANRAQRDAAESLLATGNSSLAEVAFLTGFSDQSAFTRAFKSWTGQTPRSFREAATG